MATVRLLGEYFVWKVLLKSMMKCYDRQPEGVERGQRGGVPRVLTSGNIVTTLKLYYLVGLAFNCMIKYFTRHLICVR